MRVLYENTPSGSPFSRGFGPKYKAAHHLWLVLSLTALGCCAGVLSLLFSAAAYLKLPGKALFLSYLHAPLLLFLNLLPPVLLAWLFYFLTRRAWAGFLGGFLPTVGVALVNYFKIRLRSDPLLAADLRLAAEAGDIVGNYQLDLDWLVWFALGCLLAGLLFSIFLMPNGLRGWQSRAFGAASCLALLAVAFIAQRAWNSPKNGPVPKSKTALQINMNWTSTACPFCI